MVPAIDDPAPGKAWPGKLLAKNQMFGSRQIVGQRPRPENPLIYISWYINDYGRLWTTMDVLGREPKNQARPWTNCR